MSWMPIGSAGRSARAGVRPQGSEIAGIPGGFETRDEVGGQRHQLRRTVDRAAEDGGAGDLF